MKRISLVTKNFDWSILYWRTDKSLESYFHNKLLDSFKDIEICRISDVFDSIR